MNLRQLQYFLAVVDHANFSGAAAACHVSQPPLSRQIRALEEAYGCKLLVRSSSGVSPTAAGTWLYGTFQRILKELEDSRRMVAQIDAGIIGRLNVACGSSSGLMLAPLLVREFRRYFPEVDVRLSPVPLVKQMRVLSSGEADVGIIRLPMHTAGFEVVPLYSEELVVCISDENPLARNTTIELSWLSETGFFCYPRYGAPGIYDELVDACKAVGFKPKLLEEAYPTEALVAKVACGYGVAILPGSARRLKGCGVRYRDLTVNGQLFYARYALARLEENKNELAKKFSTLCGKYAQHLLATGECQNFCA